jgi:hypothetical protein
VKAQSRGFASQVDHCERSLTSWFVVSCCPLLSPRFRRVAAPARPTPALSCPVGLRSVAYPLSNLCSIRWSGGDLARPGPGPADRSAAGTVRGAARRRPGHHLCGGRQRRAVCPRRRHQGVEPDAAGTPAPTGGVWPAARRLPRPSTNAAVAHTAKHRPDQDDHHLREPQWPTPTSTNTIGSPGLTGYEPRRIINTEARRSGDTHGRLAWAHWATQPRRCRRKTQASVKPPLRMGPLPVPPWPALAGAA